MTKKNTDHAEQGLENVESALTSAESFIEKNQKRISYILLAIIIVVVGFFGYNKFIAQPKAERAMEEIFMAQQYFAQDSFNLALQGDGAYYGFLDIIDNYKGTAAGNLAHYYAGVCYLNLGEFDAAGEYLRKFESDDLMVGANAQGLLGDVCLEQDDVHGAIKHYEKAAKMADNDFLSPVFLMKAGQAHEIAGQYEKALNIYKRIETEYYGTREQRDIEKYQVRAEMNIK